MTGGKSRLFFSDFITGQTVNPDEFAGSCTVKISEIPQNKAEYQGRINAQEQAGKGCFYRGNVAVRLSAVGLRITADG